MSAPRFRRVDKELGEFTLHDLDPETDTSLLHRWVTHPKSRFWLMEDSTAAEVTAEYRRIAAHPHHDAYLGRWRGNPNFLAERYDPAMVELRGLYPARPGDIGMHFLCAPTDQPVHGFSLAALTTVMAWLFSDLATQRVVVDPDVRNTAIHALNESVGFDVVGSVTKPEKTALLSICTRERFTARTRDSEVLPR